jgi:hypothetical protein
VANEVDVRQMAMAPLPEKKQKPQNRFSRIFCGRVIFKAVAIGDPLKFDNGTTSTRLAQVLLEIGKDTDAFLKANINLHQPVQGDPQVVLTLPSSGTRFKQSVIACETPQAEIDLSTWKDTIAADFIRWHKGNKTEHTERAKPAGVSVSLADLGMAPRLVKRDESASE